MPEFPGFPSNDFDFHFEEAGGALAGLLMRDLNGDVLPGVLPAAESILSPGVGWSVKVAPFVAARSKGRAVLLGGSTVEVMLDVSPAPAANARLDVIYSLPADVGAGDPVRGAAIASGTPGAVPSKPSIPVGAIELGTLRVSAGQSSAAAATLTETFRFAAMTGGEVRVRKRADLSSLSVISGTAAYVVDERTSYRFNGSAWVATGGDDSGWINIPFTNGAGVLKLRCRNDFVEVRFAGSSSFEPGQTTLAASGSVPARYRPESNIRGSGALNSDARAGLYVTMSGTIGMNNSSGTPKQSGEGQAFYYL